MRSRLDLVVRLRELRERRALGKLAAAEQALRAAGEQLEAGREAHRGRPRPTSPLSPLQLRTLELQGLATAELIAQLEEDLAAAEDVRARRRSEWSDTSTEHRSAERAVDRRRVADAATAALLAQRALDEAALLRRPRR